MFRSLFDMAGYPFRQNRPFGRYHSFSYDGPLASHTLSQHFFFLPPLFEGEEIDSMRIDGQQVGMLWAVPITDRELAYKDKCGATALMELFRSARPSPAADEARASLV
jgi:Suppressor of fused protein (SUFU)